MSGSLVFEFPLPRNIANYRSKDWRGVYGLKKSYYERLDELVTVKLNPRCVAGMPWVKAEAEVQMRTLRVMDRGNAHHRATKWPFDWLESRGYIQNDRDLAYTLDPRTAKRADLGITLILRRAA